MQTKYSIPSHSLIANRAARRFGTSWATGIQIVDPQTRNPIKADLSKVSMRVMPCVSHYDGYHAESRTGIRASMAALKRFWSTYHYVSMECIVEVADVEAVYNNDNH